MNIPLFGASRPTTPNLLLLATENTVRFRRAGCFYWLCAASKLCSRLILGAGAEGIATPQTPVSLLPFRKPSLN
ncbi:MAG: hypothetical protein ACOVSW_00170, partial [Candidatus Kapaibacteriota bacterium]